MKDCYSTLKTFCYGFWALLFTLTFSQNARASHAMGADIQYRYVGVNGAGQQQYLVTVTFYRNCSGIAAPTAAGVNGDFSITNTCGFGNPTFNFTQVTNDTCPDLNNFYPTIIQTSGLNGCKVSQLCPAFQSQSTCATPPGTYPGVERYEYTALITLPGSCSQWKFSFAENARNSPLSNITGGGSAALYVEAMLNNTLDTNSAKVVIPGLASTYYSNLSVKNASGCTAPLASEIFVGDSTPLTVTITSASSAMCTNATPRALTALPVGGTWTVDGVAVAGTFNPSLYTPGLHRVDYTYTSGSCVQRATQEIEVVAPVLPTLYVGARNVCRNGGKVLLGANPMGGVFYVDGNPISGNEYDPATSNASVPIVHTVRYIYSNGACSSNPSLVTANDTIRVNPIPEITNAVFTQSGVCGTFTDTITLSGPGLSPLTSYTLQYDSNHLPISRTVITNAAGQIVMLNRAPSFYQHFLLSKAGGCSASSNVSVTLSNPSVPYFQVGTLVNPSNCSLNNGSITLTGLTPATLYGVVFDSCGTTTLRMLSSDGSGNIVLSNLPSCTYDGFAVGTLGSCIRALDTTIVLADVLTASVRINSSNAPICVTALPRTLQATVTGGSWKIDGVNNAAGSFDPSTLTVGRHLVSYTYTSGSCTIVDTQYVSVVGTVSATMYTSTPNTCVGDTLRLGANPAGGIFSGAGVSGNNFSTSGSGVNLIVYTYTSPFGCISQATQTLTVNALPAVTGINGAAPSACGGSNATITLSGLQSSLTYAVNYDSAGVPRTRSYVPNGSGQIVMPGYHAGIYNNFQVVGQNSGTSGCRAVLLDVVTISDPGAPVVSGISIKKSKDCSTSNGSITLTGKFTNGQQVTICYDSAGVNRCRTFTATANLYANNSINFGADPVPFYCANSPVTFNNAISDRDGDSLVSLMVTPLDDGAVPLGYQGGFSLASPITTSTGTSFNNQTGQLSFTPSATVLPENDVLAFRFNEYRNGVLVGYTMRDVQIVILQCTQTTPVLEKPSSLNGGTLLDSVSVQVCPGSTSSFDIVLRDPNQHNILVKSNLLNAVSPLPGATLVATNIGTVPNDTVKATISWMPQVSDTGCHYFSLTAQTDDCPVMGSYTKVYRVCVVNRVTVSPHRIIYCGTPITLTASGGTTSLWSPPTGLSSTTAAVTYATPNATTKYTYTSSCGTDTALVIYNPPFIMSAGSDATICQNGQTQLSASVDNTYAPYTIKWTPSTVNGYNTLIDPVTAYGVDNILNPVAQPLVSTCYRVTFTANTGCIRDDTVCVTVNGTAPRLVPSAVPNVICSGDTTRLYVLSSPTSCGASMSPCTGVTTSNQIGSSSTPEAGTSAMYPSPFGANRKSARHQYLIRRNELLALTGSGGSITTVSLQIANLNGATALSGFTIKLGCTQLDSLTGFVEAGLVQVKNPVTYTPVAGWNNLALDNSYDWDGSSNLVVDLCFANTTNGSANNKMMTNPTGYRSTWWTASNAGSMCGNSGSQTGVLTLSNWPYTRPNMRFAICQNRLVDSLVTWTPNTGPNAANPAHNDTSAATPGATTTYKVNYTTPSGCSSQGFVTVTVNDTGRVVISPSDTFMCSLQPVQLHAALSGSANPALITYTWSARGGTAPPSGVGLSFANPTVTPTGNTTYICTIVLGTCTTVDSTTISIGTNLPVSATIVDSVKCAGQCNAKIRAVPAGGIPPLNYVWSVAGSSDSLMNLCPGTYKVTVTDHQGCVGTDSVVVPPRVPISLRMDSTNINCFGAGNGTVSATVTGGAPSYTYTWSPAQSGNPSALSSLAPGLYQVTVADRYGCTINGKANVVQPSSAVSTTMITRNISGAGLCDGMARVQASGGTAPYTYTWSNPPGGSLDSVSSLCTGTYYVTVCDAKGCCKPDSAVITVPPPIFVVFVKRDVKCFGGSDGFASFTASGGVLPYTFAWSNGLGTNDSILNVIAGTYTVTVTDSNNISVQQSVTIGTPDSIHTVLTPVNITCHGLSDGSISAAVTGGTPGYSYSWQPGGTNANPLTNLAAGNYWVEVTDLNGCKDSAYASVTEPPLLQLSLGNTDSVRCFGQSNGVAEVHPSGGTPGYSFTWSATAITDSTNNALSAGPFSVTVTDSRGCTATVSGNIYQPQQIQASVTPTNANCATSNDGSAIATVSNGTAPYTYVWNGNSGGSVVAGLPAGNDTLVVSDFNGCTVSAPFVIDTNYVLHLRIRTDSTSCFNGNDGSAYVTALNGAGAYSYNWNPANNNDSMATALVPGTIGVTVTDAHNCTASIIGIVEQPSEIILSMGLYDPLCHDEASGKAFVNASGGSGGYTYAWDNVPPSATDTAFNLTEGTYHVQVSDSKGCLKTGEVILGNPAAIDVTSQVTPISCFNTTDGQISVAPSGGTGVFTYQWSPAGTDSFLTNLGPASYSVTIADDNGCDTILNFTLAAPSAMSFANAIADSVSCPKSADGAITVMVTGGTPGATGYQYSIEGQGGQQPSGIFSGLGAGTYQVNVQDSKGCRLDTTLEVGKPQQLVLTILPQDSTINMGSTLQLATLTSGYPAAGIRSYTWSPINGLSCGDCPNPSASPFQTQRYTLIAVYGANCADTATVTVAVENNLPYYIPSAFSPNGDGNNDVFMIYGEGIKTVGMKVFNRWGEKVFDSENQWVGWDGTYRGQQQPPMVYTYTITIEYLDGKKKQKDGSITLVR
ncbi:MAG: gliding motility-associated C-terminal domain-containing protein [Chitinophagales bacterium]